uniref:Putative secreted protein n=1 Tax=Anopheles darlingi TaxID=43151 RepID=A0A2M4DCW5_ANODA
MRSVFFVFVVSSRMFCMPPSPSRGRAYIVLSTDEGSSLIINTFLHASSPWRVRRLTTLHTTTIANHTCALSFAT